MIRRVLVLAFHLALLAGATVAAERPKIGLVLAGGGAAGVAHVGVIRELERLGLRPDYVAGASMGAIVGGLYAAGYGPDDLERAVQDIDWLSILNDQNDRSIIHPLRRDSRIDPFSVQADLPVGVGAGGVQVAAGLVDGVRLTLILRELTALALGIEDFDKLPIPFRAVATDLATGQPVVLGEGDLTMALRASMSIPALFPPVRIDGRLLVDGGVSNNLPIDVARAMGADVVIAVFIPPADVDPDRLATLSASLAQTMSIFIHARSRELIATLGEQDVLIAPDVGAVGMLDFAAAPDTVAQGIAAAEAQGARLAALAADRPTPPARAPVGFDGELTLRYDRIVIDYDGVLDPEVLRRRLDLPPSGEVTPARIQTAAERLYGLDLFQNVGYRLDKTPEGDVLVVDAQRKRLGAPLRFGLGLDTEFGGDSDFTLALGASLTELNPLGGRIDVDGSIGQTEGVRVLFEQPLDYAQTWFAQGGATYVGRQTAFYPQPDNRSAEFRVNTGQFGGGFQFAPADWGRVGAGVSWRLQEISLTTGDKSLLEDFDIDEDLDEAPRVALSFDFDTLDDVDLPRTGRQVSVVLAVDPVGDAETDTSDIVLDALSAWSFGQHTVSPFFYGSGELRANGLEPHFIGGFQRLSGFGEGELFGNVVGVGGLRYYRRFSFESPFGREAFAGGSLEYGGAWLDWGDIGEEGSYAASALFAGVQTAFGPLILGFGFGETGQVAVTLGLGTRF